MSWNQIKRHATPRQATSIATATATATVIATHHTAYLPEDDDAAVGRREGVVASKGEVAGREDSGVAVRPKHLLAQGVVLQQNLTNFCATHRA